ncbi:hypothetical protein LTR08_003795 [Meristemomyces frigidus]|nr:hypothetical protein LTR08_003795 [Meristemomyces frigidus]
MPKSTNIAARASETQVYTDREGNTGTLTTRLEIQAESEHACCAFVEARFALKMDGANEKQRAKNIGHLYAYLVDRTALDKAGGRPLYLIELTNSSHTSEVATVFCEVFTKAGDVRAALEAQRQQLAGEEEILLIDTLWLREEYHGKGVAQMVVSSFHSLLPRLTNGYAFRGTVLLSPATSANYKKDNGKSDVDVEAALVRSYEKSGYVVWKRGSEEVEGSVTVMGRVI